MGCHCGSAAVSGEVRGKVLGTEQKGPRPGLCHAPEHPEDGWKCERLSRTDGTDGVGAGEAVPKMSSRRKTDCTFSARLHIALPTTLCLF